MINRRQAIKAVVAAVGGAAMPLSSSALAGERPSRARAMDAPIAIALVRNEQIVAARAIPNATVRQHGNGLEIWGDPVTFPNVRGRIDGARVLVLFAPDVVLEMSMKDVAPVNFAYSSDVTVYPTLGPFARITVD
jgi:hypothetical protein